MPPKILKLLRIAVLVLAPLTVIVAAEMQR